MVHPPAARNPAEEAVRLLVYEDEESFRKPLEAAIESCTRAFTQASRKVRGAEARTRAAIADLKTLEAFIAAVSERMRSRSFHELPGLKRGGERIPGLHSLTVDPWRGVFLVDADETGVVALVFSRAPHALEERFDEIADRYRSKPGNRTGRPSSQG